MHKLLFAQLATLTILLLIVLFGTSHTEFWSYPWFSATAHFLGGLWVGLFAAWCFRLVGISPTLLLCIGAALVFGICWEIFELFIGVTHFPADSMDTWQDIGMDMIGGFVSAFFVQHIWLRR